jgi:signal transduction histidine kinase
MKNLLRSFYIKISAIFLVLLLIMAITIVVVTQESSESFFSTADQTMNWNLAKNIAADFKDAVEDSIDYGEIEHMMHYMMVINPGIEIYLLDESGKVMAFFAEPHKKMQIERVNLEVVKSFIAGGEQLPIYGDDPRSEGRKKIFSAAPITFGNIDGFIYVIIGSEQFDTAVGSIWQGYITENLSQGLLISIAVTGLIGLILFGFLTRRLRLMESAVQNFEQGKFDERIDVKRNDELGHLANSFNKMADTIVANMEELKKTDYIRRELIANVSHDLRNPIASIKGYLETIQLKDDTLSGEERTKYIDSTLQICVTLENLIEQLFQLSKLDSQQIKPQLEPFSIADLLQDVVMKFKPIAEKKSIKLDPKFPQQLPHTFADIGLIERAISNLIDNAIQYTPENGEVKIEIAKEDGKIKIVVSDTGYGISEEELPLIFNRFYRVEKSRARSTGGTGLGLAIAKKIIDVHNSTISVTSKIDAGTTFSFLLDTWQPA